MEIPYSRLKLLVQISSRTNLPSPHMAKWGYAWETTTSELFCQAINMRQQSASTDFIKCPFGKDRNCPNSILATAGGLIFREDLPKTQTELEGSSQALPGQDFPPAPWSTQSDQNVLGTPSAPSLHSGSGGTVPAARWPWPAHPRTGTGQCHSPAWSPGRWRWQRMGQMFHQPAHLHWDKWGRNLIICSVGGGIVTENSEGRLEWKNKKFLL